MPEMPITEAFAYARWLGEHASLFLSINQQTEAFRVSRMMAFAGTGRCELRRACPSPTLPGYVEELYRLGKADFASLRFGAFMTVHGLRYCLHPVLHRLSATAN
jgi:hypothetical protein